MSNFAPAEAEHIKLQWHRNEVKMKTENSKTAFWNAPFDCSLDTESDFGQCRVVRLDNKNHGHICTGPWWLVGWVLLYVHRNRRLIKDGKPRTSTSTFTQLLNSGPWWKHGQLFVAGVADTERLWVIRLRKQHRRLSKNVNIRRIRPGRKKNSVTIQTIPVLFVLAKAMRANIKETPDII